MKRYYVLSTLIVMAIVFAYCSGPKKAMAAPVPKMTYAGNLEAVIMANCSPCHIPSKGGNKKPYDNFASVKTDIDDMIRRIELNPGERGFMPQKRSKLSDSTIAIFKQWRSDGLIEK